MAQVFKKLHWTEHSKIKMRQYGLSKQKLLGILRKPERKEKGIVPGTTAVMKTNKIYSSKTISLFTIEKSNLHPHTRSFSRNFGVGARKAPGEIWIMYKNVKDQKKIISAWRYPGISKPGEEIPIPMDIREELLKNHDIK
jgi:hypothetical protein